LSTLLQNVITGLAIGSVYALFALGYTLIFSVLRIINFAHGAVFTAGAYLVYLLMGKTFGGGNYPFANKKLPVGMPFLAALIGGALLAGMLNVAIERLAFRPLRNRGSDTLLTLVSSLGVSIMVANAIQNLVGADPLPSQEPIPWVRTKPSVTIFGANVLTVRIVIFVVAMAVMGGLWFLLNRTTTGMALKAVSEDGTTANLLGISTDRLIVLTFALCGAIAAIAGAMVSTFAGTQGPYFGASFGLIGLAVIIMGGLGDVPGAVLAGFVIGVLQASIPGWRVPVLHWTVGSDWKDAIPFFFLFLVLMVRPNGLLGRTEITKV
jgi:branched-chain amino acid transport system permease protein